MEAKKLMSFELEVRSILSRLTPNDTCSSVQEHELNKMGIDYYLPWGIEELNIPPKTGVIVKYNLLFDSLERLKFLLDKKHDLPILALWIITKEKKAKVYHTRMNYMGELFIFIQ